MLPRSLLGLSLVCAQLTAAPVHAEQRAANSVQNASKSRALSTHWSLALQQDFAWVSGDGVCSPASQSAGHFSCFRPQGGQYLGTPRAQDGGRIGPGFLPATTRALLEGQWHFARNWRVGGRLGYVLRGAGPKSLGQAARAFLPLHLELRADWLPWGAPELSHARARPMLSLGFGLAQIDARARLRVREDRSAPPAPTQLDNPDEQTLDVYKKLGTGFAALGVGVIGSLPPRWLWRASAHAQALWPSSGLSLSLELGVGFAL